MPKTDQSLKMITEAVTLKLNNTPYEVNISYWKFKEDIYTVYQDDPCSEYPGIMLVDDKLKSIITDFDPKYITWAGEDGLLQCIGYPEVEELHKVTPPSKFRGIPTSISKIHTSMGDILFIGQCECCGNLSIILFKKSQFNLVELFGALLPHHNRDANPSPKDLGELIKTELTEFYGIKLMNI